MSRYSSDSDDDFRGRKSRQKRHRSVSSSSEDSFKGKRGSRRSRKSRSRSRDGNSRQSSRFYHKDKHSSTKGRSYHRRSPSPSYRSRKQRSYSRSRSRSRGSSYGKSRTLLKSKRGYRSRSRSRSHSRRSSSRSYRRNRSRSRSSSCRRKSKHTSNESSSYDSDRDSDESKNTSTDTKKSVKPDSRECNPVIIASDDPVIKQQQIDEIDAPSFVMKSFKSGRKENQTSKSETFLTSTFSTNGDAQSANHDDWFNTGVGLHTLDMKDKKNDTVFHDSIVFEDSEVKIQKWIKKIHKIRQKFLTEPSQSDKNKFIKFSS